MEGSLWLLHADSDVASGQEGKQRHCKEAARLPRQDAW